MKMFHAKGLTMKELASLKESYEKLQQLDKEVIALQKMGQSLTVGHKRINLSLKVEDLLTKVEAKRDTYVMGGLSMFGMLLDHPSEKESYQTEQVTEEINDVFALELVAFLLNIKEKQRKSILSKFQKHGIEI